MRQIVALSAALLALLVGTYLTWNDTTEEPDDDAVAVYQATSDELQKVTWTTDKLTVVLEPRTDAKGSYIWVTSSEQVEVAPPPPPPGEGDDEGEPVDPNATPDAPAPDAAAPDAPAPDAPAPDAPKPEPVFETKVGGWRGNDAAQNLFDSFAPLMALRSLAAEGVDREALGFQDPTAPTIEVVRRSGPIRLQLGGETFGAKNRYLDYEGNLFLVKGADLGRFPSAQRSLIETRLFPETPQQTTAVVIERAGAKVKAVHTNRDDETKAFWAREESADREDLTLDTWIDKLFKLTARSYVDPASPPPVEELGRVEIQGDLGAWSVVLLKQSGEEEQYFAQSDFDRSLVLLPTSSARGLAEDLSGLFEE